MSATGPPTIQPIRPKPSLTETRVFDWCARLRLLEGVPFTYMVPYEEMLPSESIRFFHLDMEWLDSLVDGALCATLATSKDAKHDIDTYANIKNEIRLREIKRRAKAHIGLGFDGLDGEKRMTGFLFRSSLVRDHPGLEVTAWKTANENELTQMRILRLERLSKNVMLCIVDGVPSMVRFQEPAEGIILGCEVRPSDKSLYLKEKDSETGLVPNPATEIPLTVRQGSVRRNSVLRIHNLAYAITPGPSATTSSAAIARALVQYPEQVDFVTGVDVGGATTIRNPNAPSSISSTGSGMSTGSTFTLNTNVARSRSISVAAPGVSPPSAVKSFQRPTTKPGRKTGVSKKKGRGGGR